MSTIKVWNEFHERLLAFIVSRVSNHEDANDILQDVFIKIHQKLDSLKDSKKLKSWIYQITRNSIIDYYRGKKGTKDENVDLTNFKEDGEIENIDLSKCLIPFINSLPDKYKNALTSTELKGMSQKEYAESIGISYSGAKSRVQRAKAQLKDLFANTCKVQTDSYGNIISTDCSC